MTRVATIATVTLLSVLRGSVALAALFLVCSRFSGGQEKSAAAISTSIDVQPANLLAQPPGANWVSYNGDYTGRRFSSLMEITPGNVANLRAQWIFHLRDTTGLEVTPVAVNGILFVTSANDAFALDARTGRSIWHYSRPVTEGLIDDASQHHNRGVGVWHSKVFLETDNAHLLCLDARSGHLLWDVAYAGKATKLRRHQRPSRRQRQSYRWHLRRRRWRSWFHRRLRRRNRQAGLAYLDNSRPRRIWLRELAWRPLSSRRRYHLDARHLRS